ncbi:MAG: hypothetical protein ABIP94_00300 [Planctomycetota bacterium]
MRAQGSDAYDHPRLQPTDPMIQTTPQMRVLVAVQPTDFRRGIDGLATRRSGKRKIVVMRTACHPRLRNAVYYWARVAAQNDRTI